MPAPEDLKTQSPGDPLANTSPLAAAVTAASTPDANETKTAQAQAPVYLAKHIAGGRWHVIDAKGDRVGDFVGDKAGAQVELARLLDGGEPLVLDPQRNDDRAAQAHASQPTTDVDATTLKQPVLTPDGWLCPEPPVKE